MVVLAGKLQNKKGSGVIAITGGIRKAIYLRTLI